MSEVNGKSAHKWVEVNHPQNGWFKVYWPKQGVSEPILNKEDSNGNLRWEWEYKDGKRADGVSKGWYRDGTLKQVKHWKNGLKHGELIRYYNNKKINDHFQFRSGKRHGWCISYRNDENNSERKRDYYIDGVLQVPRVSYILVWADTNSLNRIDSNHYQKNKKVDDELLKNTLKLIQQILEMNPLEILVMDNEGNFPKHENSLVKVIPSYQSVGYIEHKSPYNPIWLEKITIDDYYEDEHMNHAKCLAMAYNHGIIEASGDYLVIQHNDTSYLDNVIEKQIELLEKENYEYITIDKKPPKGVSPKGYDYFADCYWFLCRGDFYSKHNIWVDWKRGDNNHLATITCKDKGLKYLHLPGFFETKEHDKFEFNQKYGYNSKDGNVHTFNDKPFIIHLKGGTGLFRILEEKR